MKKSAFLIVLFILIGLTSCENEPVYTMVINTAVLDDELQDLVSRVPESEGENAIECIRFNYPFAIFIFDENMNFIQVVSVSNDAEFVVLLDSLNENYSISLNYPISGTLSSGEQIEINTNAELKDAIDTCLNIELKGRCDNTLIDCNWKVTQVNGGDPVYLDSKFRVDYTGIVGLHLEDEAYFGTWVTLLIGNELYLNIDLNDDEEIETFWDANWRIELVDDERMWLSNNGVDVLIEKDCSVPCELGAYQVCELESNPGFAMFDLNAFTPCIGVPPMHDLISAVTYSFYETEEDAINDTNEIEAAEYTNTENPQTIYVRTVYIESGELLNISEIIIEAVTCNGG